VEEISNEKGRMAVKKGRGRLSKGKLLEVIICANTKKLNNLPFYFNIDHR
jgi:hypothetical protein